MRDDDFDPSSFGPTTQQVEGELASFLGVITTLLVVLAAIWFVFG